MKPKNCCKKCRSLGLDFKRDFFCYAYEDYCLNECELYKNDKPITTRGKWIYDSDCMITSCCNKAYDINKFVRTRSDKIYLPTICPNCMAIMEQSEGE